MPLRFSHDYQVTKRSDHSKLFQNIRALLNMYLPLFQDLIAVGQSSYVPCSHRHQIYSSTSRGASKPLSTIPRGRLRTMGKEEFSAEGSRRLSFEAESPESAELGPQTTPQPIGDVPRICVTPPDSREPPSHTMHESPSNDDNHIQFSEQSHEAVDQYDNGTSAIEESHGSKTAASTSVEDGIGFSGVSYEHDSESLAKDFDDWLKLAQETGGNDRGHSVVDSADCRVGPSMQTTKNCQELIRWRPKAIFIGSDEYQRKPSVERRFSLNQSTVYPFRTKRNSV